MADFKIYEEYFTLHPIRDSTKDIFREFHAALQEVHLDSLKMFAVAFSGCPSVLGTSQELINCVKIILLPRYSIIAFYSQKVSLLNLCTCLM